MLERIHLSIVQQVERQGSLTAAAGVLHLTKQLALELSKYGIRVNSILTHESGDTLGHLAAYLASDYAAYVTGAVMGVGLDD